MYSEQRKAYRILAKRLAEMDPKFRNVTEINARSLVIRYDSLFPFGDKLTADLTTWSCFKVIELKMNQLTLQSFNVANWSFIGIRRVKELLAKKTIYSWRVKREEFVDYFSTP